MLSEPIAVTLLVIDALEALDVPYLIGGSLASAVHGVARTTADTDLVADLRLEHADPLAHQALMDAFYVDAESIREAVQQFRGERFGQPIRNRHPQKRRAADRQAAGGNSKYKKCSC